MAINNEKPTAVSTKNLTAEELIKLESKPRNKNKEILKLLLPIIVGVLAILEYLFMSDLVLDCLYLCLPVSLNQFQFLWKRQR